MVLNRQHVWEVKVTFCSWSWHIDVVGSILGQMTKLIAFYGSFFHLLWIFCHLIRIFCHLLQMFCYGKVWPLLTNSESTCKVLNKSFAKNITNELIAMSWRGCATNYGDCVLCWNAHYMSSRRRLEHCWKTPYTWKIILDKDTKIIYCYLLKAMTSLVKKVVSWPKVLLFGDSITQVIWHVTEK